MNDSDFCAECEKRVGKIGIPQGIIIFDTSVDCFLIVTDAERAQMRSCIWERHLREWLEKHGVFNLTRGNWDYQTALLAAADSAKEE